MAKASIGVRLRRPRNDSLGATSEEGSTPPQARRAHSHGSCNVVLLFRHTVGRAAPRRQHRRSLHGEDVGRNPHATYANTRSSHGRRAITSVKLTAREQCRTVESGQGPSSARLTPTKVSRPCGAESTRSPCPGSSREATIGCSRIAMH